MLKPLRSYPEIDGIRGILSLLVLFGHIVAMVHWPSVYVDRESPMFWYWGCMEVFFCISGFLITRGLVYSAAAQEPHWVSHYLMKRALRIWPAYYVALIAALAVSLWIHSPDSPSNEVWNGDIFYLVKTCLFLHNTELYYGPAGSGAIPTFGHSWSVALEEQFYLLILGAIVLRKRFALFPRKRLLLLIAVVLPLSQLARSEGLSELTLIGRSEGFLAGIALAILEPALLKLNARVSKLRSQSLEQLLAFVVAAAGLVLLAPYLSAIPTRELPFLLRHDVFDAYFGFSALAFFLVISIVAFPQTAIHRFLRTRALRYLGQISYSTYLFHIPVLLVVSSALKLAAVDSHWLIVLGPAAALTVSTFTFRTVERPFLKLKDRLDPHPRRHQRAAVPTVADVVPAAAVQMPGRR